MFSALSAGVREVWDLLLLSTLWQNTPSGVWGPSANQLSSLEQTNTSDRRAHLIINNNKPVYFLSCVCFEDLRKLAIMIQTRGVKLYFISMVMVKRPLDYRYSFIPAMLSDFPQFLDSVVLRIKGFSFSQNLRFH